MNTLELAITCISLVLGVTGVATVFTNAYVKASRLKAIEDEVKQLWQIVRTVTILETKIPYIENGIRDIKELLGEKRNNE